MFKYLFGPVPSRRLGMSLGVDLVPKKVCSLNCVYCEVGETTNLTCERKEYIQASLVIEELKQFFSENPDPDYITFSGSGEPTLNSQISEILNFIKKIRPDIPVAVLTNGTLFSDKQVRDSLLQADLVLPSLDAATEHVFNRINRPAVSLTCENHINGLIKFRDEFSGTINLEVFILPGYNDSSNELRALKEAIIKIRPDSVQLNTLDRPGIISGLRSSSCSKLQAIKQYWNLPNVEIIASAVSRKKSKAYRIDVVSAIIETISRRPCTLSDLEQLLGLHVNELNKYLDVLEAEKKIMKEEQDRGVFYKAI
jgi:wyosine [tRNA(Phe)-imidazoG37] synthetase (radical SAM superfamily)